jgi:hypothetical protein
MGINPDTNLVLVAQLTTKGEISFELNVVVDTATIGDPKEISYVANGDTLLPGEKISPSLKYPPVCGCTDPNYLEYNAGYGCSFIDSCKTLIIIGCMDPLACNYNPDANFSVPTLCCYPGYCNDRDLDLACPNLGVISTPAFEFDLFPNPVQDQMTLQVTVDNKEVKYSIYNSYGMIVFEKNLGLVSGLIIEEIDMSNLENGLYLFRLDIEGNSLTKQFIKN